MTSHCFSFFFLSEALQCSLLVSNDNTTLISGHYHGSCDVAKYQTVFQLLNYGSNNTRKLVVGLR